LDGIDTDTVKYSKIKFVIIIQVCCQIAIQIDGKTTLRSYAYGKSMDRSLPLKNLNSILEILRSVSNPLSCGRTEL